MKISERLAKKLETARSVCVLTGAGISAESGVPTFRSGDNTLTWRGMPFTEISSARMVREDLAEVWEWFDYRRGLLGECRPNAGHIALAEWQERFEQLTLITQNIDNLHFEAGSRDIIELHGNIFRARCEHCGVAEGIDKNKAPGIPICESCGGRMRPDVVLFGEMLPVEAFELAAERAAQSDLFFVVGTSAMVYPAASLPEIAKRSGAFLVEVNPEVTPLSPLADEVLKGKAAETLPGII